MPCSYGKTLRRQQAVDLSCGRILDVLVLGTEYLFEGLSLLGGKLLFLLLDMRWVGATRKRTIKTR